MKKRTVSVVLSATLIMACAIVTPRATPTASAIPSAATPSAAASLTESVHLNGCLNAAGPVRLRAEPNTQAKIITRIPPASCFPVYGYNPEHTWVWIDFQGHYGWVAAQYVSIQGEARQLPEPTPSAATSPFATLRATSVAAPASSDTPIATGTLAPSPTTPPVKTPTALAIASPTTLLCADTSSYASRNVKCKIPLAYCSYYPAIAGTPTYCIDAPYANKITVLIWGQDWSDYDGKCIVISGRVSIYEGKPLIVATSRSQISVCP